MNIGIDAHFLSKINQGTGTYTYQLVNSLSKILDKEDLLILLNKNEAAFKDMFGFDGVSSGRLLTTKTPFNVIAGYHLSQIKLNLDIIHTNYLASIWPSKAKKIVTIHDILFKTHKRYFPEKLKKGIELLSKFVLPSVDYVITVSGYSKRSILEYYPFLEDKICVIYEAASSAFFCIENKDEAKGYIKSKFNIDRPYVLFVGRFAPIKNLWPLIDAHNNWLKDDFELVLVGDYDSSFPNDKILSLIKESNIKHLKGISDVDLNYIYNCAELLYFVSHGEGFGLPILEAMATGCPVITSNTTSCAEIAGDCAIRVSPSDSGEILSGMKKVLYSEEYKKNLRQMGLIRSKEFTWEKCAKETLGLYKRLT